MFLSLLKNNDQIQNSSKFTRKTQLTLQATGFSYASLFTTFIVAKPLEQGWATSLVGGPDLLKKIFCGQN